MKAEKNGHIKQLKAEQQLALGRIQRRVLEHKVRASELVDAARAEADKARAADAEFGQAVQAYAKTMGVDLAAIDIQHLIDKLQFKKKETSANQ